MLNKTFSLGEEKVKSGPGSRLRGGKAYITSEKLKEGSWGLEGEK